MSNPEPEESRGAIRWVVLILMSLVIFANYYLYDCFSTLKATLQAETGATSTQWGLVRNFYNIPNTFLFMALHLNPNPLAIPYLFALGMLLGYPWALQAWGPNWWWDPKICSSLMMWA